MQRGADRGGVKMTKRLEVLIEQIPVGIDAALITGYEIIILQLPRRDMLVILEIYLIGMCIEISFLWNREGNALTSLFWAA